MTRALVVCPGRGSYDRSGLGQLQDRSEAARAWIDRCDAARAAQGRPTVRELDAAERFRATQHVAGEHASLLTFACSMADLADLSDDYEIVGVTGNSMGFYTALAATGALPPDDAIRLVETMGSYQTGNVIGGQVLTPICTPEGQPDPDRRAAVEAVRDQVGGHWSIDLGGFAVLGADPEGVHALLEKLPTEERGSRTFPVQLPLHSAFHTPLMEDTSRAAQQDLADLSWQRPSVPLVDGRGFVFRPLWTDEEELASYTLGHQVVKPFGYTTAVRTGLRHCAPDVVILLGPGNSLGGPTARILTWEGWRGATDRAAFEGLQAQSPLLLSFGVPAQRAQLT